MEFEDLVDLRRSCRSYSEKPVSEELLKKIFSNVIKAPCSCNRQLWKFIVVDKDNFSKNLKSFCPTISKIDPPQVIFCIYDMSYNNENHANYQSVSAAVMTLLLSAKNLGVDTCWMAGFGDEIKIRQALKIPNRYRVVCAVCIGYGLDSTDIKARKRPVDDILCFNSFTTSKNNIPDSWNPEYWTLEDHKQNLNYSIYAKSPSSRFYRPFLKNEFNCILHSLPSLKGKVLYFNPFAGNYLGELIKLNDFESLDVWTISEEVAKFIKNKFENENLKVPSFIIGKESLTELNDLYDHVVCIEQIEKFSSEDRKFFFDNFSRLLKKGGKFHFFYSNSLSPYWIIWRLKNIFSGNKPGLRGPFRTFLPGNFKINLKKEKSIGISLFPIKFHSSKSRFLKFFFKTTYDLFSK